MTNDEIMRLARRKAKQAVANLYDALQDRHPIETLPDELVPAFNAMLQTVIFCGATTHDELAYAAEQFAVIIHAHVDCPEWTQSVRQDWRDDPLQTASRLIDNAVNVYQYKQTSQETPDNG